jgi:uncharacterized protein
MKIYLKQIPAEGQQLSGSEPPSIMELDEPDTRFEQEIRYDLTAQVQGGALLVTGRLATTVALRCARCLKSFPSPLAVSDFVVHRELRGEDFVDLTSEMREDIILGLPQRALCDRECKGLCPNCGVDLNKGPCSCPASRGDRRWQALDGVKLP